MRSKGAEKEQEQSEGSERVHGGVGRAEEEFLCVTEEKARCAGKGRQGRGRGVGRGPVTFPVPPQGQQHTGL